MRKATYREQLVPIGIKSVEIGDDVYFVESPPKGSECWFVSRGGKGPPPIAQPRTCVKGARSFEEAAEAVDAMRELRVRPSEIDLRARR